ncbi:MAG: CHASE2 domain-containing protein [Spirulina sp.]
MRQWFKSRIWQWRGVWVATPLTAIVTIALRGSGLLQPWELGAFDLYLRLRPPLPPDDRVVIVGIDETDVKQQGRVIFPDRVYGELIATLAAMQPRAIGLDVYRNVPVPPGHGELTRVFAQTPNLVGIEKVFGDGDRDRVSAPPILKEQGRIGANDILEDPDGRVRRGFAYVARGGEKPIPSFAAALAKLYLDAEGVRLEKLEETGEWRWGRAILTPLQPDTGGYVRAKMGEGFQILIDYRGGRGYFETVPLRDVLAGRVAADWGRDRIILIGAIGESFNDLYLTPYSSGISDNPLSIAGVEIFAHLASQFVRAALDGHPLFRSWPEWAEMLWIAFWCFLGAGLSWQWRYGIEAKGRGQIWRSLRGAIASLAMVALLLGGAYLAILRGWWIPVVPPLLGFAGSTLAIASYLARSAGKIRQTFGRYLNDAVVSDLLENPEALKLGGKRQKITILTSDLRGFTALSERLPPEMVVEILNCYLQSMLGIIGQYGGTIDDLMGDGILVLFGVPVVGEDDARRALACAIAMQIAMKSVNEQMAQNHWPTLEMGIGINTGECVVGNLGSDWHTEYSAVGRDVNFAFRVETYTTGNQIFISQQTLEEVGGEWVEIRHEKRVHPKGMMRDISIYEIAGVGAPYYLDLPEEEEIFCQLLQPRSLLYLIVEGKQVGDRFYKGELVQLSHRGAIVQIAKEGEGRLPDPMTNLKLNFFAMDEQNLPEIGDDFYAKVVSVWPEEGEFTIRFTYRSPNAIAIFKALLEKSLP